MSRGLGSLGSPNPSIPLLFLKIIYSVTRRKKKRLLSTRVWYAFVMMLLSEEQDGSLPTHFLSRKKKPRHFYLSLCVFSPDSFACWGRHHLPWAILAWPIESPKSFCLASKFPHLSGKRAECNLASVCNQVPSVQEFARLAIWHQESPKVIPTQTTKIQKITNA